MNIKKLVRIIIWVVLPIAIALLIVGHPEPVPVLYDNGFWKIEAKKQQRVSERRASRVQSLEESLKRFGSPLSAYASDIVRLSDKYGVDVYDAVAIIGVETSFGKSACFGHRFNVGCHRILPTDVSSFVGGLEAHFRLLGSPTYSGRTLREIAYTYAPPEENDTEKWIRDAKWFREELKK